MKNNINWETLSIEAWATRENAYIIGPTKVGCTLITENNKIFSGCNIEHKFRSHDIHAETNTISSMIASGEKKIKAIFIAAERERFTPCGACMDWIFQFGGKDCLVAYQTSSDSKINIFTAHELMPHYPM